MQTLADRLRREGEKIGEKRGKKIGVEETKLETARQLIKRGVDMDIIVEATGVSKDEIEKLTETVH